MRTWASTRSRTSPGPCECGARAWGERSAGIGFVASASGQAVHRSAAVREPVQRPQSGILRRRRGRGHHQRVVAFPAAVRDRAQLELHLQGPPGDRHPPGRARAGRALRARGQRAAGRGAGAHCGSAHRRGQRGAFLGRPFRWRACRRLRPAGQPGAQRRRRDRATADVGRGRAGAAQARGQPGCI